MSTETPTSAYHTMWNGKTWKPVKNLGWLLRHANSVEQFDVVKSPLRGYGAHLTAFLRDGTAFAVSFVSSNALAEWLVRPSFIGKSLVWFGRKTKIRVASARTRS